MVDETEDMAEMVKELQTQIVQVQQVSTQEIAKKEELIQQSVEQQEQKVVGLWL
jgi:hypothetical protein